MEQKRKVKSLISTTETSELGFLSKLLIVLSCLFCFWALFLIIFSVSFVRADDDTIFSYTGFDEKKEVIYDLGFVRSGNLSKIISTMKVDDVGGIDRLYVTPVPVVVYGNVNEKIGIFTSGYYVNLLGGKDIIITGSDNISIIGGRELRVETGNSNVTILGGKNNKINSSNLNAYNVVIGGESNTVGGKNSVILGGKNNIITGNNSFILGGDSNKVSSNNVIVAGINVNATKDNIFVYSNDNNAFTPKKENTFYINVQKGLGINMKNKQSGVMVSGAVKFGNLGECGDGLIGLISDSFIHGCAGNGGLEKLGNVDDSWLPGVDFNGYCTGADYLKVNAGEERYQLCSSSIDGYKNVIFETKILSGDCANISNGKNPCVYKCAGGYHYDESTKTCKKDCKIPWNENYKKHGEIITGYTEDNVLCSPGNTCNSKMAKLKCEDGVWTKTGGNGPAIEYDSEGKINYNYEICHNKKNEACDKNEYKFTSEIKENWIKLGKCTDYGDNCKAKIYYKGKCFPNYNLNDKKNECVPQTRLGICSDLSLPQNAIKLVTGFKQTASGNFEDNWYPTSKNYVYDTELQKNGGECTYKCDTGYLYSTGNSELKLSTGCWTGCVFKENNTTKIVYNHGKITTGFKFPTLLCTDEEYICINGNWEKYDSHMKGEKNVPWVKTLYEKCRDVTF